MRGAWGAGLAAALLYGTSAYAQTAAPAPVRQSVDGNGVDLYLGTLNITRQDASIGAGASGLSYSRIWRNTAWVDNYDIHLVKPNSNTITVTIGGAAENFSGAGPTYANAQGGGSTLARSGSSGSYVYTYTAADGTVYGFLQSRGYTALDTKDEARVDTITRPDGMKLSFVYFTGNFCTRRTRTIDDDGCVQWTNTSRLSTVTSNLGYKMTLAYASDGLDDPSGLNDFYSVSSASLVNLANNASRTATYSGESSATTDAGRTWTYTMTGGRITAIQRPGHAADIHIAYDGNGLVQSYTDPTNIVTTYAYSDNVSANEHTTWVQVGSNAASYAVFNLSTGLMKRSVDELGHVTTYDHGELSNSYGRLVKVTAQDGNATEYQYDGRGNIMMTIAHAKPASGLADIATAATFDTTCANPKTCNKPTVTVDGNMKQTNYTYDVTGTGLLTSVTLPQGANGDRPLILYDYVNTAAAPSAWGGGTLTLPKAVRRCRTQQTCTGSANETVVETAYNDYNTNFLPANTSVHAGDNSLSSTVSYFYDGIRNLFATTDPLGYVTYYGYTPDRDRLWVLSPDPDGSGPLKNRMTVTDYSPDRTLLDVRVGTANGDSSGFTELQRVNIGYDAAGRKVWEAYTPGGPNGITVSLKEYSYDSIGRLDCTNARMNTGNYYNVVGSVSPCDLSSAGLSGPDRITRNEYDAAGRLTRSWAGYRTATSYHTDYSWTNNNKLEHLVDPNVNTTTYYYDGFDRLRFTCFTTTSCGAAPIYEELFYDNNSNVTGHRLRDGNTIAYTYDALNQLTQMTPPAATGFDKTKTYTYDNIGHLTGAAIASFNLNISYTYDALGRITAEGGPWFASNYQYDAAGRMTFLGYGDGFYVNYDYYATGEMFRVRENGATSGIGVLAQIGLDQLGRKVSVTRGNGTSESWIYDQNGNGAWPNWLTQAMGSSGSVTFGYGYNPMGQISNRSLSHDGYAWQQQPVTTRTYDVNGLNQYTRSGSVTLGYDARGNLTGAPVPATGSNADPGTARSYAYTLENQLVVSGSDGFYYDAAGRLSMDQTGARVFGYMGSRMLLERDYSLNVAARYVYGPDEAPLVWYEGSGTGNRHWLAGDERGSVIAVTDDGGNVQRQNSYDEYGIPGSNNLGRFGYTGQAWNATLGLWYYKARIYSPTLGRFMQTDPIGYGDGVNWYNYAHGDPVNGTDPSGTNEVNGCTVQGSGDCIINGKRGGTTIPSFGTVNGVFTTCGGCDTFDRDLAEYAAAELENTLSCQAGGGMYSSIGFPNSGVCQAPEESAPSNPLPDAPMPQSGLLDRLKNLYCSLPSVGVGGTASGYDVVGGGISTGLTFDPQSGRLGVSAGINVGVGVGFNIAGSTTLNTERSVPNGVSASLGVNANVRVPGARVGVAGTLINTQGFKPQFNGVSGGLAPGVGVTANANLSANIGVGLQVLPSCH